MREGIPGAAAICGVRGKCYAAAILSKYGCDRLLGESKPLMQCCTGTYVMRLITEPSSDLVPRTRMDSDNVAQTS